MALRAATPEDAAFLKDLFMQVRSHVFAPLGMPAEQVTALLEMQYQGRERQYCADYPDAGTYIFEQSGFPIGAYMAVEQGDSLRLIDLALVASSRRLGIGQAFLTDMKQDNGCIRLSVEMLNPARRLYEREGFRETHNDGVYASMTWGSEDREPKTN